jgi:hypothetical protein
MYASCKAAQQKHTQRFLHHPRTGINLTAGFADGRMKTIYNEINEYAPIDGSRDGQHDDKALHVAVQLAIDGPIYLDSTALINLSAKNQTEISSTTIYIQITAQLVPRELLRS